FMSRSRLLTPPPPIATLFPYTTLFRSITGLLHAADRSHHGVVGHGSLGSGRAQLRGQEGTHLRQRRVCRAVQRRGWIEWQRNGRDRKSTRLNSSHVKISYAVFCLKKKN